MKNLIVMTETLARAFVHPRTPWCARVVAGLTAAYALSPIDLIPDFIPVIGLLDDLLLIPLGFALAARLIPEEVMEECRARAAGSAEGPARLRLAGIALVAAVWIVLVLCAVLLLRRLLQPSPR